MVTYVYWLQQGLRALVHRVSVFTSHLADVDSSEEDVYAVAKPARGVLQHLFGVKDHVFGARGGRNLASHVLACHGQHPFDVFEMEESFGWFVRFVHARQFGVVVKLHGPAFQTLVGRDRDSDWARRKIAAERTALREAQAIIAPSRATLDPTLQFYSRPRISARTVNPLALPSDAPLWNGAACDPDAILFVGRFDAVKGADRLLQIFKRALVECPALRLTFVGPTHGIADAAGRSVGFSEYASGLSAHLGWSGVSYLGRQPPSRIAEVRARSTLTLVASRCETRYTALEAMLQRFLVACCDTSGLPEAIVHERNRLLFDGDDLEAGASQLLRPLESPRLAAKIGKRAARTWPRHPTSAGWPNRPWRCIANSWTTRGRATNWTVQTQGVAGSLPSRAAIKRTSMCRFCC